MFDKPYLVIYVTKETDFFREDFQSYEEARDRMEILKNRDYVNHVLIAVLQEEWERDAN